MRQLASSTKLDLNSDHFLFLPLANKPSTEQIRAKKAGTGNSEQNSGHLSFTDKSRLVQSDGNEGLVGGAGIEPKIDA